MTRWVKFLLRYSSLLFLTFFLSPALLSQTIKIWNPLNLIGGNKNWDNQFNWIEIGFPSANEVAKFENASDSVYLGTAETLTGLILNGGAIAGTGSITVSDSMNWNGGTLIGSGSLTFQTGAVARINGPDVVVEGWTVASNGNMELAAGTSISGSGWITINDTLFVSDTVSIGKLDLASSAVVIGTGVLEISDSLNWNGATFSGSGTLRILTGAVATLSPNEGTLNGWTLENIGTFRQDADLSLVNGSLANSGTYHMSANVYDNGGTNVFSNSGDFVTGDGSGIVWVPFNTSGTVTVEGGSLTINGGGEASGMLTITEPASITFIETDYTFDGPIFSGSGWTIVDADIYVTGNTTISKFDFSGYSGSIQGTATVTVTDSMLWGAGRLNGTGELIIGASATVTTPPVDSYLNITNHIFTNYGAVIQSNAMDASGNAVVANHGSYRIESSSVYKNSGAPAFNNFGQLEFSDIYGSVAFQVQFSNTGSTEIQLGVLPFSGGGSNSGTISILVDTAAIEIPAGVFTLSTGTDVSGEGFFRIDGGTVTLDGTVLIDKLAMDSGSVNGNGNLTVRDTLLWGGGTIGGAGQLIIAEEGHMSIMAGLRAASRILDVRELNNLGGVVQWADYNVDGLGDILNGGTYELMGNHVIVAGETPGYFINTGTLNKLAGPPNGGSDGRIEITLFNDSTLFIDAISSLELSGGLANFLDNVLTGGTFTIAGTLTFPGAAIDTNDAIITLAGGNILDEFGNPALSDLALNKGTLTIENSFFSIGTHLQNEGTFIIAPGCSLNVQGYTQVSGVTYFRSGFSGGLNPSEGGVDVQGGSFYGHGDIYGSLANSADLFIGEDVGRLSVSSFFQSPEGTLHVDIGGPSPAESYDQLSLPGGLATLDGTVKAKLINDFVPDAETNVFEIVEHEGRDSTFDAVFDLDPGDGIRLIADYASNSVTRLVANFAPIFTQSLPDTTIDENQTLSFSFIGEDPEVASVFYSIVSLVEGASIDSANGNFSWTPNYDQSGVHELVIGVRDAFEMTLDTIQVTVLHVNRAPFFTVNIADTTVAKAQELQFTVLGTDLDLDVIKFFLVEGPVGAEVDSVSGVFSWTPSLSDSGSHKIIVSLTDGLLPVLDTAWVEVTNTNVLPTFVLGLPDTTILENSTLNFSLTGSDFDLNALSFAKFEGPEGLSVASDGTVEWTTTYDDSGTYQILLSVSDGIGFVLDTATVIVANVNRLPLFVSGLRDTTITEAQTISSSMTGTDPDSDPLTFSLFSGPDGADVSAEGLFTWTPSYTDSGSHAIVVSLGDGFGAVLDTAWIYVSNANIPPEFVLALPDTVIDENTNFTFTMTGSDFDLNALTFAKVEGPEGLTVAENGTVEWMTTYDDSGSHTVVVSLFDGFVAVTDTATLVVANLNRLPAFLQFLPDTIVNEAQLLSFSVTAADPDSDSVTFGILGPEGALISSGGLFTWTPSFSDSGLHAIVISAGDGMGLVKDTAFVTVLNVNRLPAFTLALSDTAILESSTFAFNLSGADADGDALVFSKISGPAALTVSTSGAIMWETTYADSGTHELIVSLSDGLDSVSDTAFIMVLDVNRLPILNIGLPDTTIAENQLLEFSLDASDPDGGSVAFSMIMGPAGVSLSAGGLFAWTPTFLQAGQDTVIVRVTDGIDAVQDTTLLTILNVNRLPGAVVLLEPADGDTLQLAVPLTPVNFLWTKSPDPDADDTLSYLIRVVGPGLDTTVVVKSDTSAAIDIAGLFQPSSEYSWNIRVTDLYDTVAAPESFSFRTSATITSVEGYGVLPTEFALGQNFPNPFNPSTTIAYDIPAKSIVTVQVFNMLGQLINTLVDDEQGAGRYTVTWRGTAQSGSSVASGIYFYRIHAKGGDREFIQTRKLMLLK